MLAALRIKDEDELDIWDFGMWKMVPLAIVAPFFWGGGGVNQDDNPSNSLNNQFTSQAAKLTIRRGNSFNQTLEIRTSKWAITCAKELSSLVVYDTTLLAQTSTPLAEHPPLLTTIPTSVAYTLL